MTFVFSMLNFVFSTTSLYAISLNVSIYQHLNQLLLLSLLMYNLSISAFKAMKSFLEAKLDVLAPVAGSNSSWVV